MTYPELLAQVAKSLASINNSKLEGDYIVEATSAIRLTGLACAEALKEAGEENAILIIGKLLGETR